MVITYKHLTASRVDFLKGDRKTAQVIMPNEGWWLTYTNDTTVAARRIPEERFKTSQKELDIQGLFIDYKRKGTQIVLTGKETVDSLDCYVLSVTFKNGNTTNYYIDSKSYRVHKRSSSIVIDGERLDNFTKFWNYRQNEQGYWFAYTLTEKSGRITNFNKIETNIPVDESIFKVR